MDWRLVVLSVGNFVAGTASLMLPGMLNEVADDLQRPVASLGLLVAIAQLAGGLSAPFVAVAASRYPRRSALLVTLLLAAASHFATAFSTAFGLLLMARAATGITGSALTPQIAGAAGVLVEPSRRGRALAASLLGYQVAVVLGVPLGVVLAGAMGWRASFIAIGVVSLTTALLVWRMLPAGLPVLKLDRSTWGELGRNRPIVLALVFQLLHFMAQMTLFVYLAPVLKASLGVGPRELAWLLAWFGAVGVAAAVVSARYIDKVGSRYLTRQALAFMLVAFLLWPFTNGSQAWTMALLALLAVGSFTVGAAQQAFLVAAAPKLANVSVAFNSSSALLGAAAGALLGAQLIARFGFGSLSWVAAAIALFALGALLAAQASRR